MAQEKTDTSTKQDRVVTRTYTLKYVTPREVNRGLKAYFYKSSFETNGSLFTVTMAKDNLAQFEEMLKKMDVPQTPIQFRIFTVIASNEGKAGAIENPDLKKVLNELQKLLRFKVYRLDGVSLLTAQDRSHFSRVKLSSSTKGLDLRLQLKSVKIVEERGGRSIQIKELALWQTKTNLLETSASIKENGYLVAGVSKIGDNGDSLILVINANIL